MSTMTETCPILMAEDDLDDRLLVQKAIEKNHIPNPLVAVADGEEMLDYLYRRGRYSRAAATHPCLILMDLNMPKMDGREALKILKSDERLKRIPVVILTTSVSPEDLETSYAGGANSYIRKPHSFEELSQTIQCLRQYWLQIVQLPPEKRSDGHA